MRIAEKPAAHAVSTPGGGGERPQNLQQAAESFEALFVGEMLKSARESGGGMGLEESGGAGGSVMEFAEEHLARVVAGSGGLGFSKLIVEQLSPRDQALSDRGARSSPAGAE